jgi:hypothetical protein
MCEPLEAANLAPPEGGSLLLYPEIFFLLILNAGAGLLTEGAWRNAFWKTDLSTVKPAIIRLESSA